MKNSGRLFFRRVPPKGRLTVTLAAVGFVILALVLFLYLSSRLGIRATSVASSSADTLNRLTKDDVRSPAGSRGKQAPSQHPSPVDSVPAQGGGVSRVLPLDPSSSPTATLDAFRVAAGFNPSGVRALTSCTTAANNTAGGASMSSVTAQEAVKKNHRRFQQCFHRDGAKFLYFGNHWGRHFNQVTSIVSALVLARLLDRTLVLPPFLFEKRRVAMHDLYDVRALFDVDASPFCVLTEDEFYDLEADRVFEGSGRSNIEVEAVCVTMRGIKPHPQLPLRFAFRCVESLFVKYKKVLPLFFEVAGSSSGRMMTVPLAIYYAEALPESLVLCPWRLIRPHPAIEHAVGLLKKRRIAVEHIQGGLDVDVRATIGVHVRSLEGSCRSRQQQHLAREKQDALEAQCKMTPEYIVGVTQRALAVAGGDEGVGALVDARGRLRDDEVYFLIADDGQHPDRVHHLVRSLPAAMRIQDAVNLGSGAAAGPRVAAAESPLQQYLRKLRVGPTETRPPVELRSDPGEGAAANEGGGGARRRFLADAVHDDNTITIVSPFDLQSKFHQFPSAIYLLLDFWTLVSTSVFVGNQVSTLSLNVCRARRADGKRCDNFV